MGNSLCDGMSSACSLDNLDITADIYSSDPMTGVPIDIIASTVAFTVPVDPNAQHVLELPIVGGPFH